MATYVIGDVQGCFDELQELLDLIKYHKDKDELWFTGDLVNRGPKSLDVLKFVIELPNSVVVLGNHDLTLLALGYGCITSSQHTLHDIISSSDKTYLLDWLRRQPLLHYNSSVGFVLVHAGIPPQWNLNQAIQYAKEVETLLKTDSFLDLLKNMFGNMPDCWQENLSGWERCRFIVNALTRIRFCTVDGKIDLLYKGEVGTQSADLLPWFKIPWHKIKNQNIVFGHWAALNGKSNKANIFPLDTGCVWGRKLTAMRLEDRKIFSLSCSKYLNITR